MAVTEAAIETAIEEAPSSNGWFQLMVPSDGSFIGIKKIVRHTGKGRPVDIRDILRKLKSHKVCHGVNADAINQLLKSVEAGQIPEEPVLIANSDIVQGKDGQLQWCIEGIENPDSEIVAAPDMQIAVLEKAIKGSAGRNVFGKTKQPRPVFDPQLRPGTGVRVEEKENGCFVFISNQAGQLRVEDEMICVDPHVRISKDHMQALMDIPAGHVPGAEQAISEGNILAILTSLNITHGLQAENIRAALSDQGETPGFVKNVVVAEGKIARDGVNARLRVDEHLAVGKVLENGQIDFYEKSYPWNIKADDIVGVVIPPQPEENGFTVTGKVIPATPAEGVNLVLEGLRQESGGQLRANRDGILLVNEPAISVTDSLVVKGDVCHRTGNINSDKAVVVKGYVQPGFILQSRGDVIVDDNVEQSLVHASGSIVVKSGIRGSQCKVISRGNITAGFVENARVRALGAITVENSLVSCDSYCHGKLYIGRSTSAKSTLIGGTTYAGKGIEAANLGSDGFKKTVVRVGANAHVLIKLRELGEDLAKLERDLNKLENLFIQHSRSRVNADTEAVTKVSLALQSKKLEFELLENEKQKLLKKVDASRKACVVIHQHVYPGVSVQILDKTFEVRKKENAGVFFLEGELIIFRPAS